MQKISHELLNRYKFLLTSNCEVCKEYRAYLVSLLEKVEYDYVYKNLKVLNRKEILETKYPIPVLFSLNNKVIELDLHY